MGFGTRAPGRPEDDPEVKVEVVCVGSTLSPRSKSFNRWSTSTRRTLAPSGGWRPAIWRRSHHDANNCGTRLSRPWRNRAGRASRARPRHRPGDRGVPQASFLGLAACRLRSSYLHGLPTPLSLAVTLGSRSSRVVNPSRKGRRRGRPDGAPRTTRSVIHE